MVDKDGKKLFTHPRWHEIPVTETIVVEKKLTEEEQKAREERVKSWKERLAKKRIFLDSNKEK